MPVSRELQITECQATEHLLYTDVRPSRMTYTELPHLPPKSSGTTACLLQSMSWWRSCPGGGRVSVLVLCPGVWARLRCGEFNRLTLGLWQAASRALSPASPPLPSVFPPHGRLMPLHANRQSVYDLRTPKTQGWEQQPNRICLTRSLRLQSASTHESTQSSSFCPTEGSTTKISPFPT